MKVKAWRISNKRHADSLFSGVGAELYGGRFNSTGKKVIYTSGSLSLAMLELVVQGNKKDRFTGLVGATATFDQIDVLCLEAGGLRKKWSSRPLGAASQKIGDNWLENGTSLVLRVPSVIVPTEYHYLINPLHPRFKSIVFGEVEENVFDARLS